jgi:hypothetical protein
LPRLDALDSSKKVNHEMPPERFSVVAGAKRTRTFVSAASGTQETPVNWWQKPMRQKAL